MKFLIAGLGSIGRRHLTNLRALGEHEIVLYRTGRSTLPDAELAEITAGLPVEYSLNAALQHRPEAVIIANPTAKHLEVALAAAQQGCHLFIEKPVSHSLEGIAQLQEAVSRHGCRVLIGYHFRFHPGLQQIASLLRSGRLGRLLSLHAHWGEYLPSWHPWEDYRQSYSAQAALGGGVVLTLSHPLDYVLWLIKHALAETDSDAHGGAANAPAFQIERLWAFAGQLGDLELDVEDTALIGLQIAAPTTANSTADQESRHILASLHLNYTQRPGAHWLQLIGTQGWLHWDASDGTVYLYSGASAGRDQKPSPSQEAPTGMVPSADPFQKRTAEIFPLEPGFSRNDLFLAEMRHFLAVARGEAEPLCSLNEGIQALELALLALRSAEVGCARSYPVPGQTLPLL